VRRRLGSIFVFIVLTPLVLMLWIGIEGVRRERRLVRASLDAFLQKELASARDAIESFLEERKRALSRTADTLSLTTSSLRRWLLNEPLAEQVFLLDAKGKRLHPPPLGPLDESEKLFLRRAGQIWKDKQQFYRQEEKAPVVQKRTRALIQHESISEGWYTWYWGSGLHLLFWKRLASGFVLGIELNRARLLSDLLNRLPETPAWKNVASASRIRLLDSKDQILYQWGGYDPPEDIPPDATLYLNYPLSSWKLQYFLPPARLSRLFSVRTTVTFLSGLGALGLALIGLAVYFYRENVRQLREAAQRVNFVNQVSHELKTPLTNIRMYAELLSRYYHEADPRARRHLDVIISETSRLSRLIQNILSFSRTQRNAFKIRPQPGIVDETVRSVIEQFTPALNDKGIKADFRPAAGNRVRFDPDVVSQIVGNLLSNVEKYARGSPSVVITSRHENDSTVITVRDEGPGIPRKWREKIFMPFVRVDDRLTEGAAGTGIGLAIARQLAHLHGGDLVLLSGEGGCTFQVRLHTPKVSS